MNPNLEKALNALSLSQRLAADWKEGAALVLAGPGVGKTTVLTTRIARILDESEGQNFRVLALTFTTKAGDEMRSRVEVLAPGSSERTTIGTFHSFCAQLLRQHGSHVGIKPDFGVYDQDADRQELFNEALGVAAKSGADVTREDAKWLNTIDQLRSRLVSPAKAASHFRDGAVGAKVGALYQIYEDALRERNVMDFNGLILNSCRLAHQTPAVAKRIQSTYRYWLIDEFQDTSPAQYRFVRFLAGESFKNVFAVADDDQIIYQWAGASYQQIVSFREHFHPQQFQIVENRRCPPDIVEAANLLVRHNKQRTPDKSPLTATKKNEGPTIEVLSFADDADEAKGIAERIKGTPEAGWGEIAVLGRNRAILQPVADALKTAGVKAVIATRRDRFVSPQVSWLQALLDQVLRPNDRRVFALLVNAANRIAQLTLDPILLAAEAEAAGQSYLEYWAQAAESENSPTAKRLAGIAQTLLQEKSKWRLAAKNAFAWFPETVGEENGVTSDFAEDAAAWEAADHAIRAEKGGDVDLAEFLQGMALRPKEPPPSSRAVRVLTVHAAKGLEFDDVWIVGMAESVLPSWQSLKSTANPVELEEERRNCFVSITRARKHLHLSYAARYRGWVRQPSRFLEEMGLVQIS